MRDERDRKPGIRKSKVLLIVTLAAASLIGGGIHALSALGTKLALEDAGIDRGHGHRRS
jgi:hypothetical protein